jgi:hypothetical protein
MAPASDRGCDVCEIIFAVEDAPEGRFVACALGYSIFTDADDRDASCAVVHDAVRRHFDDCDRPKVICRARGVASADAACCTSRSL